MVHCRAWLSPSASSPPTPSAQRGNTVARLTSPGAREKLSPMVDEPENLVLRYLRAFDEKVDACARTSARSRCAWAGSRPPWRTCMSSLRSTPCASTGLPQLIRTKAMSDDEGILRMQPTGRWAVCRPGRVPVEITSAELFRIEADGERELQVTRMEYRHFEGPMKGRLFRGLPGEYYSVHGYWLRDGLRAALDRR
jgi:hypothetical protein